MLAIFTVFVILCSMLALNTFEAGYIRQSSMVQRRMAIDTTRAVAATVETELNYALRLAVEAGMYEAGKQGENKAEVEELLRRYFNQRIEAGWSYQNFESIDVPLSDEESLVLVWLPDGSLHASGYLDATFTHREGLRAYGVRLETGVVPRYGRLLYLAYHMHSQAMKVYRESGWDNEVISAFRDEINENFACEYLHFKITPTDHWLRLSVEDRYSGRAIAENED